MGRCRTYADNKSRQRAYRLRLKNKGGFLTNKDVISDSLPVTIQEYTTICHDCRRTIVVKSDPATHPDTTYLCNECWNKRYPEKLSNILTVT